MSEPIKIHPFDMYALLNDANCGEVAIYKHTDGTVPDGAQLIIVGKVVYEQTCSVPPLTDEGKRMLDESMRGRK